jgi:hypothetical protein
MRVRDKVRVGLGVQEDRVGVRVRIRVGALGLEGR